MATWVFSRPGISFSAQPDLNLATETAALPNTTDGLFAASISGVSIASTAGAVDVAPGGGNDDYGVGIRIMSGATVLAAADAGGGYETVQATADSSTYPKDFPAVSFTYYKTDATAAEWDAAVVEYQQTYAKAQGADNDYITVAAGSNDITVTYAQLLPNPTISLPTQTSITQTTATVGCTTDRTDPTLYYYISTSATPPSSTDLRNGTGAVDFGNTASPSIGANTFSATGLDYGTTYYTHFVHNNGSDSNILSSTSWSTDPSQFSMAVTEAATPDTLNGSGTVENVISAVALTEPGTADTVAASLTVENVISATALTEPASSDTLAGVLDANIAASISAAITEGAVTDTASGVFDVNITGTMAATDADTDTLSANASVENVIAAVALTDSAVQDTFSATAGQFMYSYLINMPDTFDGYLVNL